LAGIRSGSDTPLLSDVLQFVDEPLETAELKDVEILASGTWTTMTGQKVTFTDQDLQELASKFEELSDRVKPPLKLGHTDDAKQEMLTGEPALGWMHNVRAVGGKLLSDFRSIPKKFHALIQAGAYRRISAEIARNWTDPSTGTVHPMVLKAAGVLGATAPAINTLKDLLNLYGRTADGELVATHIYALADPVTEGVKDMLTQEQLSKLLADVDELKTANAQNAQFSDNVRKALGIDENADPVAAITTLKSATEVAVASAKKVAEDKFAADVTAVIDKAKNDGKLAPADEADVRERVEDWRLRAAQNNGVLTFSEKGQAKTGTVVERLTAYFADKPVVLAIRKEQGKAKGDPAPAGDAAPVAADVMRFATTANPGRVIPIDRGSHERHAKIQEYMKENKVDYFTAFHAVNGLELNVPAAN